MSDYPRVTQILSDLGIRSAGAFFMKPKHRRRGRLVHEACHIIGKGGEIEDSWFERSSGLSIDENDYVRHAECIPYIDGYRKFMRDKPISLFFPLHVTEAAVVNKTEHYVGHIDQIGDNDQILDIKTGRSEPWARLQTALYARAYLDACGGHRFVLELPGDGDYRLIHHDDFRDLSQAIILVRAWHIIHNYGGE